MLQMIAKRLLLVIPTVFCVSILTFTLSRVGGNPVDAYIGEQTPPKAVEHLIEKYHFDEPIPIQYWYYLQGLVKGDWGLARSSGGIPVLQAISAYLPASVELATMALLIAVLFALPLGVAAATHPNRGLDNFTRIFSLIGVATPGFWLAMLLQYYFFYKMKMAGLPHLPLSGRVDMAVSLVHPLKQITGLYVLDSVLTGNWDFLKSALSHLVLPAMTLGFMIMGIFTRLTRASMLEILHTEYITVARAKGATERKVVWGHALRNALLPLVTVFGLRLGVVMSGAILIEMIFSFPGLGLWAVKGIQASDFATVMGFVLTVALIRSGVNLATDITYGFLDPRIQYK